MTMQSAEFNTHPLRLLRSIGAVFAGLVAVIALSLGTDTALHALDVYPPWGEPMNEPAHNLIALAYRCVYAVFGSYVAARLAPRAPMFHAMTLGVIGLVLSMIGLLATWNLNLGPRWFSIALVLSALPCAWLGGVLHRTRHSERQIRNP